MAKRYTRKPWEGIPDIIGTVRGYKDMTINPAGQLRSSGFNIVWRQKGPMTAECMRVNHGGKITREVVTGSLRQDDGPAHPAPDKDCWCGFYAWYDPFPPGEARSMYSQGNMVLAVVEATGEIIPCQLGMRAEKMQVIAACVHPWATWGPECLTSEGLDWDIPVFGTVEELAARFPPRDDVSGVTGKTPAQMRTEWLQENEANGSIYLAGLPNYGFLNQPLQRYYTGSLYTAYTSTTSASTGYSTPSWSISPSGTISGTPGGKPCGCPLCNPAAPPKPAPVVIPWALMQVSGGVMSPPLNMPPGCTPQCSADGTYHAPGCEKEEG